MAAQLARQNPDAYEILESYYKELHPEHGVSTSPTAWMTRDVVEKMTGCGCFGSVSVVIDGVDECDGNAADVVRVLTAIADNAPNASICVLSRGGQEIRQVVIDTFTHVDIEAQNQDVHLYVAAEINARIQRNQLRLKNIALKDEILSQLKSRKRGVAELPEVEKWKQAYNYEYTEVRQRSSLDDFEEYVRTIPDADLQSVLEQGADEHVDIVELFRRTQLQLLTNFRRNHQQQTSPTTPLSSTTTRVDSKSPGAGNSGHRPAVSEEADSAAATAMNTGFSFSATEIGNMFSFDDAFPNWPSLWAPEDCSSVEVFVQRGLDEAASKLPPDSAYGTMSAEDSNGDAAFVEGSA
ncbi:hypothetical protein OQA88_1147 [Cercophora sp. LCS_1]